MSIGYKIGTTYYSEFKDVRSIANPVIDNEVHMKYRGFFSPDWDHASLNFDDFGYGLRKTVANQGSIFCEDASKLFTLQKGYVGILLDIPLAISNGVYRGLNNVTLNNDYILFGVNVGQSGTSLPGIYAALTENGIRFEIWSTAGRFFIMDQFSNIPAGTVFFEFLWDNNGLDDFRLQDFKATMCIRINEQEIILGNAPIENNSLSDCNFYVLDTPLSTSNMECTIRRLTVANELPKKVEDEWQSSSSSTSSSTSSSSNSSSSTSSLSSRSSISSASSMEYSSSSLSSSSESSSSSKSISSTSSESESSSSSSNARTFTFTDLDQAVMLADTRVVDLNYTNVDWVNANSDIEFTVDTANFRYMWLPNSNSSTVTKVDVRTATSPTAAAAYRLSQYSSTAPSRTIVDANGDCWVASRAYGCVTKIGLTDALSCRNACANISGSGTDIRTWGLDDAALFTFVPYPIPRIYTPSVGTPSLTSNVSIRGLTDDANNNIWVEADNAPFNTINGTWFKIANDGSNITTYTSLFGSYTCYGAVCSYPNNYIWLVTGAGQPGGLQAFRAADPTNTSTRHIFSSGQLGTIGYYGICYSRGYIYVGDWTSNNPKVYRININIVDKFPTNDWNQMKTYVTTFQFTGTTAGFPRQFAVHLRDELTNTEDIYISFYSNNGTDPGKVGVIYDHKQYADNTSVSFNPLSLNPSKAKIYSPGVANQAGIAVSYDATNNAYIWILNHNGNNVKAIDTQINDWVTFSSSHTQEGTIIGEQSGAAHYCYTNFTGTTTEAVIHPTTGTIQYILDSFSDNSQWKKVCLTTYVPAGATLTISVAASNTSTFGSSTTVTNCVDFTGSHIVGRYLKIIIRFTRTSKSVDGPKVSEMSVEVTGE